MMLARNSSVKVATMDIKQKKPNAADLDLMRKGTIESFTREEVEAKERLCQQDNHQFSQCIQRMKGLTQKTEQDRDKSGDVMRDVILCLMELKKLNRIDKLRLRHKKDQVLEMRSKVDDLHLQMQNLQYEVMHVRKEIQRSLDYRNAADDIDLEEVDVFLSQGPPDLVSKCGEDKETHTLTLSRLEWELQQRNQLAQVLEKESILVHEDNELISRMQQQIGRLKGSLLKVVESVDPIVVELNIKKSSANEEDRENGRASASPAIHSQTSTPKMVEDMDGEDSNDCRLGRMDRLENESRPMNIMGPLGVPLISEEAMEII